MANLFIVFFIFVCLFRGIWTSLRNYFQSSLSVPKESLVFRGIRIPSFIPFPVGCRTFEIWFFEIDPAGVLCFPISRDRLSAQGMRDLPNRVELSFQLSSLDLVVPRFLAPAELDGSYERAWYLWGSRSPFLV